MEFIKSSEFPHYFTCPFCPHKGGSTLKVITNGVRCKTCQREYKIRNHILEFVKDEELDKETRRELKGNKISLSKENIEHYAKKDEWSDYYNHFVDLKFNYLLGFMKSVPAKGIISLGSGPGFELKQLLKRKHLQTVFSSDLAYSTTRVVPQALKDFDVRLSLFTSDINHTPVIPNDEYPLLIYEALHHTGDIHQAIEKLMQKKFKNIFFVEPATNFVIRILARFNLAQRIEYSGVKPDFLNIPTLRKLAKKHKYNLRIKTLWDIPEEFARVICKKGSLTEKLLLGTIDLISKISDKFQFGSFAVVSLERKNKL